MTTLTWLGHSCFKLIKDEYSIVFDPYEDGETVTTKTCGCQNVTRNVASLEYITRKKPGTKCSWFLCGEWDLNPHKRNAH